MLGTVPGPGGTEMRQNLQQRDQETDHWNVRRDAPSRPVQERAVRAKGCGKACRGSRRLPGGEGVIIKGHQNSE